MSDVSNQTPEDRWVPVREDILTVVGPMLTARFDAALAAERAAAAAREQVLRDALVAAMQFLDRI